VEPPVTPDGLEAARQAVAAKDWTTARRILAPLVARDPYGVPGFLLARTELELGRPESAGPLVTAFRAQRPRHVGSAVLASRIHLAKGELGDADTMARKVLELEPHNEAAHRLLQQIAAAVVAQGVAAHLETVDARYPEARSGDPSAELLGAAQALHDVEPAPDWTRDPAQAKIAYFHHARDLRDALRSYDPVLIDVATRFDLLSWPSRMKDHLGASVLDVGCGSGGLGIGYLVAGASSYTGIDPALELDSTRARNRRTRRWEDLGVTPRRITEQLPAVRLVRSAVEDHPFDGTFDTIVLHNVSEHLADPDRVLVRLRGLCHPGTRIVLLHHSFYSWSGHKRQPRLPAQLDERNPDHRQVYDWQHVVDVPRLPEGHDFLVNLNRLRLDELRAAVERHFVVEEWDEMPSDPPTLARLTPAVLDRVRSVVPDITERELTVNSVYCVGRCG
jgi:SAM-dependent methyltransferase